MKKIYWSKLCYNGGMKKKIMFLLVGIMMFMGAMVPRAAFAAQCGNGVTIFGLDPWYAALECDGNGEIANSNFQGDQLKTTILNVIGVVVKDLLFVAGFGAVGFVMYGGFLMITSAGNPSGVEKAKKTISGAIIGLIIAVLAYAIVTAIMNVVTAGEV